MRIAKIPLSQGQIATIDIDDLERVSQFKWHAEKHPSGDFYAIARASEHREKKSKRRKKLSLHKFIMGLDKYSDYIVDHKNSVKLDCRKENLRVCTDAENARNTLMNSKNTSGFKGVVRNKRLSLWEARITFNYKRKLLGYFKDIVAAARAYDEAAVSLFGEFAKTNAMLGRFNE